MSAPTTTLTQPVFRSLFPDWSGPRPLSFFMMEALLEARAGSVFPTNLAVRDEDVNVYLAHLLTRTLGADPDPRVTFGSGALLHPPAKIQDRRARAEHYRVNAEHRMLWLGLFNRGDGLRRRNRLYTLDDGETRRRDMAAGQACFSAAADLLDGRPDGNPAVVAVWRKLADHFEDYVTVLAILATGTFGLGARLNTADLDQLLPSVTPQPTMDDLLDLWRETQKAPGPEGQEALASMAAQLGVDPATLTRAAG